MKNETVSKQNPNLFSKGTTKEKRQGFRPSINQPPSEDMYALDIVRSRSVSTCTTSSKIPCLFALSTWWTQTLISTCYITSSHHYQEDRNKQLMSAGASLSWNEWSGISVP